MEMIDKELLTSPSRKDQIVIALCSGLDNASQAKSIQIVEELSLKGYRTLAIAKSVANLMDNIRLWGCSR